MAATFATFSLEGDKLPADVAVTRFEAVEAISTPYTVEVALRDRWTPRSGSTTACAAGCCLRSSTPRARSGYYDGIVDRAGFAHLAGEAPTSRSASGPRWPRSRTARTAASSRSKIDRRRRQDDLRRTPGVDKVEWRLPAAYEPREFIVQYRESQLNFVQRLLEDEGIFYFFRHKADGHTIDLADDPGRLRASDERPPVSFAHGARAACPGACRSPSFTRDARAAHERRAPPRLRLREAAT